MSDSICNELALIYDPEVVLNMQSTNGEIDKSLGLACNVPFLIGDITLYLQVHIIRNPAYDVLLGRPFDILTESIVKNCANEDQTIQSAIPTPGGRRQYRQCEEARRAFSTGTTRFFATRGMDR